jgi:A/G-specific adenine glycosylase
MSSTPPPKDPSTRPYRPRAFARALLRWYDENRRDLPWRRTRDPYAIWVSETMLQQTQVATVVGYYERWMRRFPTLTSLARASEEAVLAEWQGLGYYSRARNLKRGAQEVVDHRGGSLPRRASELLTLPGIGPYSAGAIASIAFDEPTPVVDGNVARVLCRIFGIEGDPKSGPIRKRLWDEAAALVPKVRAGDFNQALMELGATVCTPTRPRCPTCPLRKRCIAHRAGRTGELPMASPRPATVHLHRVAAVVVHRRRLLLVQSPPDSRRWRGLWLLPTSDVNEGEPSSRALRRALGAAIGRQVEPGGLLTAVRHSFTHHRITLDAYHCPLRQPPLPRASPPMRWWPLDELEEAPLPAPYRRIVALLD